MARKKRIIPDVEIIDIGDKGLAIGRTSDGEICLIDEGPVPGDVINMIYLRKKKGLKFGAVHEFIRLSPHRVDSFCKHFEYCGGCKWQHLDYSQQLHLKQSAVKNAIRRIAKEDDAKVKDIKGCTLNRYYRNKLEYTFSTKRWLTPLEISSAEAITNREGLGFHISGAFDKVLNIEECHLQDNHTDTLRNGFRELAATHGWSYYDIRAQKGLLRNLLVRNSTLNQWMVMVVFGEDDMKLIEEVMQHAVNNFPNVNSWYYMINMKANSSTSDLTAVHWAGETHIVEQLTPADKAYPPVKYKISPKSFFQTNSHQSSTLYDEAVHYAGLTGNEVVYDLYTGTGSIALYLANHAKKVVGIEIIKEAIEDAHINAAINGINNTEFVVGDVKDILDPDFTKHHGTPDVLITDPPRAGMQAEVIEYLLRIEAPKIVYISCNPSTQARDILMLSSKYKLSAVTPVDMFPHTSHIESVALLTLNMRD